MGEIRDWCVSHLDCWLEEEIFETVTKTLRGHDIDEIVDALVVFFISCPPSGLITNAWTDLALQLLRHHDDDVRDSAVAGAFFGFWRSQRIRERIEEIVRNDSSSAVRTRAKVLQATITAALH